MKIITVIEDTCGSNCECIAEHGLSIWIETEKHRLLLDTGASDAFIKNSDILGIDLKTADTVILSHGHYDHSGGIIPFSKINKTANIFMRDNALALHYSGERNIGSDTAIADLPNIRYISGDYKIDDELFLFGNIKGRRFYPTGNDNLLMDTENGKAPDDFSHEQCLVITQNGKKILLSGCAHNGMLNILDRYREIFSSLPDYVISGFHLTKKYGDYTQSHLDTIALTAKELAEMDTVFYTGHCTGSVAYDIMKRIMQDKLNPIHSGDEVVLN